MTGVLSVVKPGVLLGDDVTKVFQIAKDVGFAIPAVNCTSSSTANAALEAAKKANSPIICQFSNGGAAFYAGKAIDNKNQNASILGMLFNCRCVIFRPASFVGDLQITVALQTVLTNFSLRQIEFALCPHLSSGSCTEGVSRQSDIV